MSERSVCLSGLLIIQDSITTEDGESGMVYGLCSRWSDGSEQIVRDITDDREALARFCTDLTGSDLEKVHFMDVIDDFLA